MDPQVGRKTWRTLEPYHGAIYFAPESAEEYAAVGLTDRMSGYFASRSAPMGEVSPGVVVATFYNFDEGLVRRSMDGVWDTVSPSLLIDARLRAADRMIRRLVGEEPLDSSDMREAAALARRAAAVAVELPAGRPLFAGHADLEWPDEPHLVLWHAQTLLREFRGDGHLIALAAAGLTGCEALVSHAATGDVPADVLRGTRQRSDDDWAGAVESLRARGLIDADGGFTHAGRVQRDEIEATTDRLALAPYEALGEEACEELRRLVRPWSTAISSVFGR